MILGTLNKTRTFLRINIITVWQYRYKPEPHSYPLEVQAIAYAFVWCFSGMEPPPDWPKRGEVTLEGINVRYAADLDPVLHDVTAVFPPGQKVRYKPHYLILYNLVLLLISSSN